MPAVLVDINETHVNAGLGFSVSITLSGLLAGDSVAIAVADQNLGTLVSTTVTDDLGNTYELGCRQNGFGLTSTAVYVSVIDFPGSPTITYTDSSNQAKFCIAAAYRGAGPLTQAGIPIAKYPSSKDVGAGSSDFTYADSTVLTFLFAIVKNETPATNPESITGDTRIEQTSHVSIYRLYAYEHKITGPDKGIVQLQFDSDHTDTWSMATVVFSTPLARPLALTKQSSVRAGSGFDGNNHPWPDNRPIINNLPYLPEIGSVVFVGAAWITAPLATIADEYGNTYTLRGFSPSGAANEWSVAIWSTVVTNLPTDGGTFRVTVSPPTPASGAVYQNTSLGILELVVAGAPTAYTEYELDHFATASQTIKIVSATANPVPVGTYLIAYAHYGSGFGQDSVAWTTPNGFAIQESWELIQFPGTGVNRDRLGPGVIFDQLVAIEGSFFAEADATITGNAGEAGGIVMLAVTIPAPPPPNPESPCEDGSIEPQPATDNGFELERIVATMKVARRITVRS